MSYQARKNSDGYYDWHPGDFFSSPIVQEMSRLERLAYRELLDRAFMEGWSLPNDDRAIARLLGVPLDELGEHFTPRVRECFKPLGDRLVNPRQLRQLAERYRASQIAQLNGSKRGKSDEEKAAISREVERWEALPATEVASKALSECLDGDQFVSRVAEGASGTLRDPQQPSGTLRDPDLHPTPPHPVPTHPVPEGEGVQGEHQPAAIPGGSAPTADAAPPAAEAAPTTKPKIRQREYDAGDHCPVEVWDEYCVRNPLPPRSLGGWTTQAKALGQLHEQAGDEGLEKWYEWAESCSDPRPIAIKSVRVTLDQLRRAKVHRHPRGGDSIFDLVQSGEVTVREA